MVLGNVGKKKRNKKNKTNQQMNKNLDFKKDYVILNIIVY